MFESRHQDAESEDEGPAPSDAWKLQPKVCCGIERATGLQDMSQCFLHPFAASVRLIIVQNQATLHLPYRNKKKKDGTGRSALKLSALLEGSL